MCALERIEAVSVVVPAFNASQHIDEALESVLAQDWCGCLECVVVDDASTDGTEARAVAWVPKFEARNRRLVVERHETNRGAGAARNSAIAAASNDWLCSLDADDVCFPHRVRLLVEAAAALPRLALLGSQFERIPAAATPRYAAWANGLSAERLLLERFREVTLIQPTWFFHRDVWVAAGKYDEDDEQCDDLRFFHRHLARGGQLFRVDCPLVKWRHGFHGLSASTPRQTLVRWRVRAFAAAVLRDWARFSVWGAGRDAKAFVNALCDLDPAFESRIVAMHDVDAKKLAAERYINGRRSFQIKPVAEIRPPFVICVALDRTSGALEAVVASIASSLGLAEGVDFWHFN